MDFIEEMPASVVTRILKHTEPGKRAIINQLMNYPEDSNWFGNDGRVRFLKLMIPSPKLHLKKFEKKQLIKETIYTLYVNFTCQKLLGVVEARHLLINEETILIKDI